MIRLIFPCHRVLPACALVLFLYVCAFSQLTAAGLRGSVADANGNVVTASPVVAKNEETGLTRTTTTDDDGAFLLAGLAPGTYTIYVRVVGFKTYENRSLKLNTGQTTDLKIRLEIGEVQETVDVLAGGGAASVSSEARLFDALDQKNISNLPLPQRDIFLLTKLSAGATFIPGAANSTKLTNSPVVTVNGNRYRGNNYVLDGAMNTNPNNTGEPALVPSVDSVEEVQVQTLNFSSEFGRGNGAVINIQTKSGTNQFHGRLWEFHRNAAANARNFFATARTPLVFNQFGGNIGGPIFKDKTFFFGSYEGTRNALGRAYAFQVETPEFRDYVFRTAPASVAARLLEQYPAPAPLLASSGGANRYVDQRNLTTAEGVIPAIGRAAVTINDYARFDQYLVRLDHTFNGGADKISGRWIAEYQKDEGGTSSAQATLGRALRGSRGPFDGLFANLNLGYDHVFARAVNDARFSFQYISTARGAEDAIVPTITITGVTAPFGDVFKSDTRLRTYEFRDTLTLDRGKHAIRLGVEARRIFKGLSIGEPDAGTFLFSSIADFALDRPFRQTLTVSPSTGEPTNFPRYFTFYESGLFIQDDWRVNSRLNINLGLRHDYFGTASERDDRLSSIILGTGNSFEEQLANAAIGRVERLYQPEKTNFSPRVGVAFDPIGDATTSVRAGFSMAYQPHHGQSINGARALPPDAIQGVVQPGNRIGTHSL
ncbi:MAG: TonB-dependent receptor [Pyrinomonadaceae bacterium]